MMLILKDVCFALQVWPHGDYPLIPVGKLVLNRNPVNYFAEVEQMAFDPSNMPPGIEPSPDKMLQVNNNTRKILPEEYDFAVCGAPVNQTDGKQLDLYLFIDMVVVNAHHLMCSSKM